MPESGNLFVATAVVLPLLAALLRPGRAVAIAVASASTVIVALCAMPFLVSGHAEPDLFMFGANHASLFHVDGLSALPMTLFALLTVATLAASARAEASPRFCTATLILMSGTLASYGAGHPLVLLAGWTISALPFLVRMWPGDRHQPGASALPNVALAGSLLLLGAGTGMLLLGIGHRAVPFVLIVLAALLRKGVFPFHSWVVAAFAEGPLLPFGLLLNAHMGAFVIARVAIPLMPELSRDALTLISNLALISAVYSAFTALGERKPRRCLALLMISQSSFVLAGLESRSPEGITGALTFSVVVSLAVMGLLVVYRALERRIGTLDRSGFSGLAVHAPRLATAFALFGLSLVGLPGTLGFVAEDLLFQGALSGHPMLGVALPVATALNAITVFRLFSSIFFGRRRSDVPVFPDALRHERLVLTALIASVVACGIAPRWIVGSRVPSAEAIQTVLDGSRVRSATAALAGSTHAQ